MKVLVLYRPHSEYARKAEEFVHILQTEHHFDEKQLEVIDYDSREGNATASIYDIVSQPGIVIVDRDGGFIKSWQGSELPLADEIIGYTFNRG